MDLSIVLEEPNYQGLWFGIVRATTLWDSKVSVLYPHFREGVVDAIGTVDKVAEALLH